MGDKVQIEQIDGEFSVVLLYRGSNQVMDEQDTFKKAKVYADYLARSMKLDVYYEGKKLLTTQHQFKGEMSMIKVTKNVLKGIETVRVSGATNMLDVPEVIHYAEMLGCPETANWIREHRSEYAQGVFTGFEIDPGK